MNVLFYRSNPEQFELIKTENALYRYSMLLWRFAPIFYFNCEHFLFVYIAEQNKKVRGFHKKIVVFNFFLIS